MADSVQTKAQSDPNEEIENPQPPTRRRAIILVVVVILVLVALGLWWRSTFTEDTDDAQVNGHLIQISSRISGQVAKVEVDENQLVKAGDVALTCYQVSPGVVCRCYDVDVVTTGQPVQ